MQILSLSLILTKHPSNYDSLWMSPRELLMPSIVHFNDRSKFNLISTNMNNYFTGWGCCFFNSISSLFLSQDTTKAFILVHMSVHWFFSNRANISSYFVPSWMFGEWGRSKCVFFFHVVHVKPCSNNYWSKN